MDMNLLNENVRHKVFGEGKIVRQEGDRIYIQFSEEYGPKKFVYPDAFEQYLKLYHTSLEQSVLEDLNKKKEQNAAKKIRKQQEYEEEAKIKKAEEKNNKKQAKQTSRKVKK